MPVPPHPHLQTQPHIGHLTNKYLANRHAERSPTRDTVIFDLMVRPLPSGVRLTAVPRFRFPPNSCRAAEGLQNSNIFFA